MKNSRVIYSLLIFTFFFSSCQKEDDNSSAPPITAENTFSCKIDGELFIPENHGGFITQKGYLVETFGQNSWLLILGNRNIDIYIFVKDVNYKGQYEVSKSDGDLDFLYDENTAVELRDKENKITYISQNASNFIEVIEFSNSNFIMLKFDEIVLKSLQNPSNQILLTNGKLNINKETLNKTSP